nr:hypothetical protein CFP56_02628 [Quercus suber]
MSAGQSWDQASDLADKQSVVRLICLRYEEAAASLTTPPSSMAWSTHHSGQDIWVKSQVGPYKSFKTPRRGNEQNAATLAGPRE